FQDRPEYPTSPLRYLLEGLSTAHLTELVIIGLICGTVAVPFIIVSMRLLHLVAVYTLGGTDDAFRNILRQTLPTQTLIIVLAIGAYLILSIINPASSLVCVGIYAGLAAWFSRKIGQIYEFGIGKGCLSLAITNATYFIGCFFIGFIFTLR